MNKLLSLQHINCSTLPTTIIVLMSKYAKSLKSSNGTIIKLSSLNAFDDIHSSCMEENDEGLNSIYQQLLEQVNIHIEAGLMIVEKKLTASEDNSKKNYITKCLSYTNIYNTALA